MASERGTRPVGQGVWRQLVGQVKKWLPRRVVSFVGRARRIDLLLSLRVALTGEHLLLYWCDIPNFGDRLNPILVSFLSGKTVVHSDRVVNLARKPVHFCIGSILKTIRTRNSVVWGTGFMDSADPLVAAPKAVTAVRGPLSRAKLLARGVACPEVYGDPALLLPLLYGPEDRRSYALGVVPHYADKGQACLEPYRERSDVLLIDVEDDVKKVVSAISSCAAIASSSLHGLIVADAYGIPSVWIKMSDNISGDDFKFHDYYESIGEGGVTPLSLGGHTVEELVGASRRRVRPTIGIQGLLASCPFIDRDVKLRLESSQAVTQATFE